MTVVRHGAFFLAISAAMVGWLHSAESARAQDVSAAPTIDTAFDRTRTTAVAERLVPGFEPRGLSLGGFLFSPELDAGVSASDNVYATPTNGSADAAAVLRPSFVLASQWSQNLLSVDAGATYTRFLHDTSEDTDLYHARAQGRYDIDPHLVAYAYASYNEQEVSRTQPGSIVGLKRPLLYNAVDSGGQLTWTSNRIRIAVIGDYRRLDYDNIYFNSGLVQPPAGLNRREGVVTATAEYAITSDFSLLVQARTDRVVYPVLAGFPVNDRSSNKHELLVGSSFEFTDFVRGEVALGYIDQQFDSPILKNYGGFGGRVKLQLFPTALTTAEIDLTRTLNEADDPRESSFVLTSATAKLDHELFRNLVLTPSVTYSVYQYEQLNRSDKQTRFGLDATWLLNRSLSLQGKFQHISARSNLPDDGLTFTDNVISLTGVFRL